jgi:NAD(P)-dependent dehydrogenase (short-subunit alcohol dehydrogenase family)
VVTGAASGIGLGIARRLADDGHAVALLDRDGPGTEKAATELSDRGLRAAAYQVDVADRQGLEQVFARVRDELGAVTVLATSAGIESFDAALDISPQKWDRILAVNLTGMFHLGQAAARQMVKQGGGGSIINVTSQLAEVARPDRAAYVASKGGTRSLTHAMAIDLAAHNIRVNAIAPGPTLTGLTRASYPDEAAKRATEALIPLGRIGKPEDLVGAVLFLASDESRWVTGSTVTVDGGYLAI